MFSILSLKSEIAFVTKSKGVCRGTLKSEDTSTSEQSKMDWQLWKSVQREAQHELWFCSLTHLRICASVYLQEMNVILSE